MEVKGPLVQAQGLAVLVVSHLDVPLGVLVLELLVPLWFQEICTLWAVGTVGVVVFAIRGGVVSNVDAEGLREGVRAVAIGVVLREFEFDWSLVALDVFKRSVVAIRETLLLRGLGLLEIFDRSLRHFLELDVANLIWEKL